MKDLYSPLEEAKADVMSIWNILYMTSRKLLPNSLVNETFVTYVAVHFRALRFGVEEAHGRGGITQLNYLLEKGAIEYDSNTQRYSANLRIFREGIRSLLHDLLMIQAKGDYDAAKEFFRKYGEVSAEARKTLERLADIPIDIIPVFRLPYETSWDVNSLPKTP